MKIVFFGTPTPAAYVLGQLLQHHEVIGVVTGEDKPVGRKQTITPTPVSTLAAEHGIITLKPARARGNQELYDHLKALEADIFIVVSYGKILPQEIIDLPKYKTLNIHYSLLPKYRGATPIQAALLNGDSETGTSIFELEPGLDTGPVYVQTHIDIETTDTYIPLEEKLTKISCEKLLELLPNIDATKKTVQDHSLATHCKTIEKSDGKIDWNKTATEIYNQWRAYIVWPEIYTFDDVMFKIKKCAVGDTVSNEPVGALLSDGKVVCGKNTTLQLLEVQPAGKKPMEIAAFLRGNKKSPLIFS